MHRREPGGERFGREAGPLVVAGGEVLVQHGFTGAVGVEAGSFLGLVLEQFEQPHGLVRRGHDPEVSFRGDQHETGRSDVEYVDAAVGEQAQQLDDVEVRDEGVGEVDEGPGQERFSGHWTSRPFGLDQVACSARSPTTTQWYGSACQRLEQQFMAGDPVRRSRRRSAVSGPPRHA